MYKEKKFSVHFSKLLDKINKSIISKKKKCIFIILPQLHDLYLKERNKNNYENFFKINKLKNNLKILDLTKFFIKQKNFRKLYLEDKHGGHLSEKGNAFVANKIYKFILKNKLI